MRLGSGRVACAQRIGEGASAVLVMGDSAEIELEKCLQVPEERTCGAAVAPTVISMCALPKGDGVVVVTDDPRSIARRVYKLHRESCEWQLVASLRRWVGPAPIVRLKETGQVAVGAGNLLYLLDLGLSGGGAATRHLEVRLPDGLVATSLLEGDRAPAVVLDSGDVLTLSPERVWTRHDLGLQFPSSRTGVIREGAGGTTVETVAITEDHEVHTANHLLDAAT